MAKDKEWQVSLDFRARLDSDDAFDIMERLGAYGAAMAVSPDGGGGGLTLTVAAPDGRAALETGERLLRGNLPDAVVTGLEAREWDAAVRELDRPLYPPVVGYAEIARMAGVTRQRAHAFPKIASFPAPVIETAQGPLYSQAAVEAWIAHRDTTPGRPAKDR